MANTPIEEDFEKWEGNVSYIDKSIPQAIFEAGWRARDSMDWQSQQSPDCEEKVKEAFKMGVDAGKRAEQLYRGIKWEGKEPITINEEITFLMKLDEEINTVQYEGSVFNLTGIVRSIKERIKELKSQAEKP